MNQTDQVLNYFAKYIENEIGIVYAEHNFYQLQSRLEEIAHLLSLGTLDNLYVAAQKGLENRARRLLLDIATNNETSFFRDRNVFDAVDQFVIPDFLKRFGANETFNIWSAASSTGQEALSTAILINEWREKNAAQLTYQITGTDISERALEKAKAATYSDLEVQRGLLPVIRDKYFAQKDTGNWQANSVLTKDTNFKLLNLKNHFDFPEPFDLVMCRNVLIYHSVDAKIAILNKVTASLKPGGYLIMGSGESLIGLSESFAKAPVDCAVIYKKKAAGALAA